MSDLAISFLDFCFRNKVDGISCASHFYNYVHPNTLHALVPFYLTRESKNDIIFLIMTLSLDPYPRIAGDSHILFQPITAISSLLDLIGPLPQGRRLFGPTVLESRQPSRNLPIFSDRNRWTDREEKRTRALWDFQFSVFNFWNSSKRLQKQKSCLNKTPSGFLFFSDFHFILKLILFLSYFNLMELEVVILLKFYSTFILFYWLSMCSFLHIFLARSNTSNVFLISFLLARPVPDSGSIRLFELHKVHQDWRGKNEIGGCDGSRLGGRVAGPRNNIKRNNRLTNRG